MFDKVSRDELELSQKVVLRTTHSKSQDKDIDVFLIVEFAGKQNQRR